MWNLILELGSGWGENYRANAWDFRDHDSSIAKETKSQNSYAV